MQDKKLDDLIAAYTEVSDAYVGWNRRQEVKARQRFIAKHRLYGRLKIEIPVWILITLGIVAGWLWILYGAENPSTVYYVGLILLSIVTVFKIIDLCLAGWLLYFLCRSTDGKGYFQTENNK